MHLKSLTLRGFKSFASATTLKFEPGITCVVGPNGSGKSNVVDALSWVMGEQGAKNLRGGKMDDVIFAGTSKRQALGRAEVTLTIDNSDGAIPVDYTEVTISRTLFRTGGSEYAVNGAPARLLDIQELLNDSGLGKEMHVIVGQGRLDAILHADPIERRSFIEEAAGVLKHRRRKDKAVRKLTGLQTNLDRLGDLRTELNRQLGPLGRQAQAAARAAIVQATLRDATARLLADDAVRLQASLFAASDGGGDHTERIADLEGRRAQAESRLTEIETRLATVEGDLEEMRTAESRTQTQAVRASGLASRAGDKRSHLLSEVTSLGRREGRSPDELRSQAEGITAELSAADEAVTASTTALETANARKEDLATALRAAEADVKAAQIAITEAVKNRSSLHSRQEQARSRITDLQARIEAGRSEIATIETRLVDRRAALTAAEAAVETVEEGETTLDETYETAKAAQTDLEAQLREEKAKRAEAASELASARARAEALALGTALEADLNDIVSSGLPGVETAVTEKLTVTTGYEMAVAAALSTTVSGVIVDSGQAALTVLDHLGEDTNVSLTIPSGTHPAPAGTAETTASAGGSGKGGDAGPQRLADFVRADDPALDTLVRTALAAVVCAPDAATALAVVDADPQLTAVTVHGEVVTSTRVSRARTASGTRLASQPALTETEETIAGLEATVTGLEADIAATERRLAEAEPVTAAALEALHSSDAQIMAAAEEVSRITGEIAADETRLSRAGENDAELRRRLAGAQQDADTAEAALAGVEDVDEVVDTSRRDTLSREVSQTSEDVIETRIAHTAATDRARFLRDRVDSLTRQAAAEEAAREQAQRAIARKTTAAASALTIAEVAEEAAALAAATVTELAETIGVLVEERAGLREEKGRLGEELGQTRKELGRLKDAAAEAELAKERYRLKLEEIEHRAEQETGLGIDRLIELFGPDTPVPGFEDGEEERPYVRSEVEKRHKEASRQLARIGTVNPLALEEYEALKERHQFLEKQIADIESSRKDLMQLVDEVDRHVERVFAEAYADTAREFEDIFSRLFPGGEGSLSLTDPDDMLTTGVDVHARPAGKKVKRLSLLSGGERSLVAVAMLVAIFKARPSPFYVMDEVEAALDDLNLSRLLTVFRELQDSSQLIVITHQKRTMEIADALYGVTMHGDGVSKVISQRIPTRPEE